MYEAFALSGINEEIKTLQSRQREIMLIFFSVSYRIRNKPSIVLRKYRSHLKGFCVGKCLKEGESIVNAS